MLIKNVSKRRYLHYIDDDHIYMIDAGQEKEIDDEIAKIWLKTEDVVKVDNGEKDEEIARLKAENEKLKAQADSEKRAEGNAEKDELLAKCKEYGLKIGNPKTAKVETLKKKIAEYESLQSAE